MAADCRQTLSRLVQTFFEKRKSIRTTTEGICCALEFFKSCCKLHEEMTVWPPSVETLIPELMLAHNQLVINVAINLNQTACLKLKKAESLACLSFQRVLQFANSADRMPASSCQTNIVELLHKVMEAVKDPVKQFKLLPVLSHLVLVVCLLCVHNKQQGDVHSLKQMLFIVDQLKKVCKESLTQQLPHKHSLLVSTSVNDGNQDYLWVGDVVRLVLSSCYCPLTEGCLKSKQWQWLDTAIQSQELIKREEYTLAMKKLEAQLQEPLDPEPKSKLLCLFAECYLHQGCPQLAILTYKAALKADQENASVLFRLAKVYNVLGFDDLELESLNLFNKVLTDKLVRSDVQQWSTDIDVILMSVCDVMPNVTLLSAIHHFAKRCFQLQRFQESAEQYQNLLQRLESAGTYNSGKRDQHLDTDLPEVIAEAAEAFSLAHKYSECINLCDEFVPVFLTDDNFSKIARSPVQMSPTTFSMNSPLCNIDSSQSSLFSQSENQIAVDELEQRQTYDRPGLNHLSADIIGSDNHVSHFNNIEWGEHSGGFQNLCNWSRKRMRSASVDAVENNDFDVWTIKTLAVRLLLSKADALVATQGYIDDTMNCLHRAYGVLTDSKMPLFKHYIKESGLALQPPLKKRKCLSSSPESEAVKTEVVIAKSTKRSEEKIELSLEQSISSPWVTSMIAVALRIARAALKRRQFPSVLNACQLILQIDPCNICGNYLKTLVSRDDSQHKENMTKQWLFVRGIDTQASDNTLISILEEKENKLEEKRKEKDKRGRTWWKISDRHLLNLDVACLKDILQSLHK